MSERFYPVDECGDHNNTSILFSLCILFVSAFWSFPVPGYFLTGGESQDEDPWPLDRGVLPL